jgi:type III secretory pathway component EscR
MFSGFAVINTFSIGAADNIFKIGVKVVLTFIAVEILVICGHPE